MLSVGGLGMIVYCGREPCDQEVLEDLPRPEISTEERRVNAFESKH